MHCNKKLSTQHKEKNEGKWFNGISTIIMVVNWFLEVEVSTQDLLMKQGRLKWKLTSEANHIGDLAVARYMHS